MKSFDVISVLLLASSLTSVYAHGFVGQVAIDGKWYAGNVPNNYKGPSPIRLIDDIGPVKGSSNKDLICGLSAQNAEMVVPANPGSTVSFQWSGGGGQKWPHNTGPLMTYMTSCGSTSCDKFDPTNAKWFKIDQLGKKDANTWYQADIQSGSAFNVVLPQNLAPGGYLIRHEIIALHLATSMGGAEFYPSCTQVMIGGNGSGSPSPTVSFPGAYSDSDPGIYDPDVYNPGTSYTFPGGPVSNLAAVSDAIVPGQTASAAFPSGTNVSPPPSPSQGGNNGSDDSNGDDNGDNSGSSSSPSASGPAPTSNPAGGSSSGSDSSGGSGSCMLRRSTDTNANRPRHYSRIMRRIMHHASAI
ncbi:hypothetical protein EIP91_001462 [Steccherinum ochraceum]|uniref:lytic cellulose monooxygenase (C4-dehydrogenating) n=1 Tax=Steccherinum ochraceum TaxID=92696 RepID=A0A4R0RGE9_9APHY|nr:hypothetical protein EIP91_001462 [Steccherinum ochraceum]